MQLLRTLLLSLVLIACSNANHETHGGEPQVIQCADLRPYSCADIYRPVCATRDNGLRCVTTPCDSTETVTYPNDCAACADERVYSYVNGACADNETGGE